MRRIASLSLFLAAALLAGCDDNSGYRIDPILSTDTVTLGIPETGLPSALDASAMGLTIGGGRYPERQSDAENWDLAIRIRDGRLVFAPPAALGVGGSAARAGVTEILAGRTFDSVIEAPGAGSFRTDSVVVIQQGGVYVARTRPVAQCSFAGVQYSKIQPLEVDEAAGTVRLVLLTNERCDDPRLAYDN